MGLNFVTLIVYIYRYLKYEELFSRLDIEFDVSNTDAARLSIIMKSLI
jgi:hypothetical protein